MRMPPRVHVTLFYRRVFARTREAEQLLLPRSPNLSNSS